MKKLICTILLSSFNFGYSSQAEKTAPLLETPGGPSQSNVTRNEYKLAMGKLSKIRYEQPQPNGNILVAEWDEDSSPEYSSYLQQEAAGKNFVLSSHIGDSETFQRLQELHGHPELDAPDKRADCFDVLCDCFCFSCCFSGKK